MIKVSSIRCAKCGDIIYSRAIHDFHWCSCNTISIDGGFESVNINGNVEDFLDIFKLKIDSTKIDLYNDWNTCKDKYGRISLTDQINNPQLPKIKFINVSFIQRILKRKWFFECSCGCKFKSRLLSPSNLVRCPKCGFIGDTWLA